MIERLIKLLRVNFYAELNTKTGWGKEELKHAFERSIVTTFAQLVDEKSTKSE